MNIMTSCVLLLPVRVYQWLDDKGKKAKVPASQYIDYVMSYTQKTICDETVFPTKYGKPRN